MMKALTRDGCQKRRETLIARINADLIVITNPRNLLYFCNLQVSPLHFGSWGRPFLLINGDSGDTTLVVDNFLSAQAQTAYFDYLDIWTWYDGSRNPGLPVFVTALEYLHSHIGDYRYQRVGIEAGWMPHGIELSDAVDITPTVMAMQRQKYTDEVALIRDAIRVTEVGFTETRPLVKPGLSEIDLHSMLYHHMAHAARHPILLLGDVISGERGAQVIGPPTERVMQDGELVILDMAPVVNGYRADFTATLCIGGRSTAEQQAVEKLLHEAVAAGESRLRSGEPCARIYAAIYNTLNARGWAKAFPHHAGHGLGLGHPEPPFLVPGSTEQLLPGDVIALEPGVYTESWGARIEHVYLISEDGYERLTHHPTTFAP